MPADISFLQFSKDDTCVDVYRDYLYYVANGNMRSYKEIVHDRGKKQGQSYYNHVIDLVAIAEKLRPAIDLSGDETRCVLLALTIHDMNKIPPYNKRPDGRDVSYTNAATQENIEKELERLDIESFFPEWRSYLLDITLLAHFHQESATGTVLTIDQRKISQCVLPSPRLKGPLKFLMKAADVADNSHSGDQCNRDEAHIRDKLLQHINAAMPERQYRFFGHRLAELRGIFTNVMHNELVKYFQEQYGKDACIDLIYYPEGVNYLLDKEITLDWSDETLRIVATRIQQRLAAIQLEDIAQFIKARPAGIVVDDAALASGATVEQLFAVIVNTVLRKQYKAEWRTQRDTNAHNDLEAALAHAKTSVQLKEQIASFLQHHTQLISSDEEVLKRGEFASAYRKFLEDHRADQLKAIKGDTWTRLYRLFKLPEECYALYGLIDPFRRGYFLATDLPPLDIDIMKDMALADLRALDEEVQTKKTQKQNESPSKKTRSETLDAVASVPYIVDYLRRNVEVWETPLGIETFSKPVGAFQFGDTLRQYANAKRLHEQCCYCGSALKAAEWMSAQVPSNIGVQSFSNRLEAGSIRDPKRNVCDACRMQFILEKLAWRNHGDKQGGKQSTFYLHLFPYSFFTQPTLSSWWSSIQSLRDSDHRSFLLDTKTYFRNWTAQQNEPPIQGYRTSLNGLGLPALSETLSNTPVLPIVAPGENYGLQFLLALEETVVLARWFECRVLLSRSPIPLLNLAHEYIEGKPVALMVEGMPRTMNWLLPTTSLDADGMNVLLNKLSVLHQLADKLYYAGGDFDALPYDFATTAVDDSLAIFNLADRLIEKKVAHEKANTTLSPEQKALVLRRQLAPLLRELIQLS